jgi:hypothetical protein
MVTDVMPVRLENPLTEVTPSAMVISPSIALGTANMLNTPLEFLEYNMPDSETKFALPGATVIVLRLVQPSNAPDPIEVTPSGIVIDVRPV